MAPRVEHDLCIVGGGPAGMMAALLFARAGCRVVVIEKHADFLRDFRGDTVHPSTLRLFDELGLLEALLARPHDKVPAITGEIAGARVTVADFSHLPPPANFIAMMPQWHFLDFLADEARRYPGFDLRMEHEAFGLLFDGDRVCGVRVKDRADIQATLVIAADGRRSVLRGAAALPLHDLGAPMDVLWFRIPKARQPGNLSTGTFQPGRIIVRIDRGDYWQCAWVIAKGGADAVRARGIAAFREAVAATVPALRGAIGAVERWEDVRLLSVALDRLTRWHCPGLLAIGDAAHAMSPIGGVGINLAVQDAVAAANLLAVPLSSGARVDRLLCRVQRRRMWPTRVTQAIQKIAQDRIIGRVLAEPGALARPPLAVRLLAWFPVLRRIPARLIGIGVRPERIESPAAVSGGRSSPV